MLNKKSSLIIMVSLLCGALLFLLICRDNSPVKNLLPVDKNADDWNGNQDMPTEQKEAEIIQVPGYDTLTFKSSTKEQKVNFYNPEANTCLFKLTLFVDGAQYWQSSYIEPGKGYYNIELDKVLEKGEYDAYLLTECFTRDGKALNNAKVEFKVKAEGL